MSVRYRQLSLQEARAYVGQHHRHNDPPIGHKYSIGLEVDGELVGVVIASRPVNRVLDDGDTIEVTRLATEGYANASSMLYGAACRAAFAMGYQRVVTYTLASEAGSSVKAAGFWKDGSVKGREWSHDGPRSADKPTMFYQPKMPTEDKVRWMRTVDDHLRDQLPAADRTR